MRNTVTVSQEFPTWAAAYEARERLTQEHGFDEHGIERIDIERLGGRFELLVRTDEFHRDQIEHLLRSSGTTFNPPARRARGGSAVVPLLLLGAAAVAGMAVYTMLGSRPPRARTDGAAARAEAPAIVPMFTLEADGRPIAVTKGNEGEARAIFESAEFREKLRTLERDGQPLWNGAGRLTIRPASRAEVRAFVQYAETLGFDDEEEGEIILYLTPIDTPDEFDETQDG